MNNERLVKFLLGAIVAVALALRFVGISPSYPPYHSDEGMSYGQGISIVNEGTLDAHGYPLAYAYPNMVPLMNAIFFKFVFIPLAWLKFWISNTGALLEGFIHLPLSEQEFKRIYQLEILGERELNVLVWGRVVAALFGIATVIMSYKFSKTIFNKYIGLLVSFLVAINYRQVLNSHINLPDIYNAFFLLISLFASYKFWKNPSLINFFIAGVLAGLSFSTKFHIYAFPALFIAHSFSSKTKNGLYVSLAGLVLTVILINPYHIVNFERTREVLDYVSSKYFIGRMRLDPYSYWYLFNLGIGKFTSIAAILGAIVCSIKDFKKSTFLLLPTILFFFIMTYFSRGGFYTRNFVSITPVILVFAGYFLFFVLGQVKKLQTKIVLLIFLLIPLVNENLGNSFIVAKEYSKPWNFKLISVWISKNIPENSAVSAHSSVPLPVKGVKRLSFEEAEMFSIEEFRNLGADYAVANLDWATNSFYGWMGEGVDNVFKFSKPIGRLENSYPGMALREISDFAIYSVVNPWQAPDSNFIVAKIPKYKISSKELKMTYSFGSEQEVTYWRSEPIEVSYWKGFVINYDIKTISTSRDGYLYTLFYNSLTDAVNNNNRIAVRLSKRNDVSGKWIQETFLGEIPAGANFMVVGVGVYDQVKSDVHLRNINIYNAEIKADFGEEKLAPIKLHEKVIFPESHGYL